MTLSAIAYRVHDGVVIVDPRSRMALSDDDGLQPLVRTLLQEGYTKFLLNLDQVQYIDSTGIGGIARANTAVTQRGGRLKLLHASPRVLDLLRITKLAPVFEVFQTEEAALQSFDAPE